ncbi:hypothetical protein ACU686_25875 [Yinghuangia aomiensis]
MKPLDPEQGDDRPVIVIAARVATGPDDVPPESPADAFPEMHVELRETPLRDGLIQQFRVNLGTLDPQRDAGGDRRRGGDVPGVGVPHLLARPVHRQPRLRRRGMTGPVRSSR